MLGTLNSVHEGLARARPNERLMKAGSPSLQRAWAAAHRRILREAGRLQQGRRGFVLTGVQFGRRLLKTHEARVYGGVVARPDRVQMIAAAVSGPTTIRPDVGATAREAQGRPRSALWALLVDYQSTEDPSRMH